MKSFNCPVVRRLADAKKDAKKPKAAKKAKTAKKPKAAKKAKVSKKPPTKKPKSTKMPLNCGQIDGKCGLKCVKLWNKANEHCYSVCMKSFNCPVVRRLADAKKDAKKPKAAKKAKDAKKTDKKPKAAKKAKTAKK